MLKYKSLLHCLIFFLIVSFSLSIFPQTLYASNLTVGEDNNGLFIKDKISGLDKVKIINSGNVGIGTTAPSAGLVVDTTTGTDRQTLYLNQSSNTFYAETIHNSGVHGLGLNILNGSNSSLAIPLRVAREDDTEYFRVQGDGNVGIGTASPIKTLVVNGPVRFHRYNMSNFIDFSSDSTGNFITSDDLGTNQKNLYISASPTGDDTTDKNIYFRTGKVAGVFQTRMTILGGGNVGIGVANPAAKLDVAGIIKARSDLNVSGNVTASKDLTVSGNINANNNKWGTCTWRSKSKNNCDNQLLCASGEYAAGIKICTSNCGNICLYCCKL
jgi:hypothetical protein